MHYAEMAKTLVEFLEPSEHVYSSRRTVRFLEAATYVAAGTGSDEKFTKMADKIASFLIDNQNPDCTFFNPTDLRNNFPGSTADIATVLLKYGYLP